MTNRQLAAEAVGVAEKAVAKLVSEMGAARDWDEAARLIDLGRQLRLLAEQTLSPGSTAAPATQFQNKASAIQRLLAKPGSKKGEYPHFFREGETLIKVAWSKSQRSEYEHKAPRKVISLLAESLITAGPKAKRFAMDKILPLRDGNGAAEVPESTRYMSYSRGCAINDWLNSTGGADTRYQTPAHLLQIQGNCGNAPQFDNQAMSEASNARAKTFRTCGRGGRCNLCSITHPICGTRISSA